MNVIESVDEVEFKDVDFSYDNEKFIIKNLNFVVKKGEKVLISGPSGCGKSTILKLISNEIKPCKGKVLETCKIGYVLQTPAIFSETIRYNLTLGKEFDAVRINEAIDKAGLREFIEEKGLDYKIEKESSNLSGGQKQRIEIARALLHDCSLLLIDEGTASLDAKTAFKIHECIMG